MILRLYKIGQSDGWTDRRATWGGNCSRPSVLVAYASTASRTRSPAVAV